MAIEWDEAAFQARMAEQYRPAEKYTDAQLVARLRERYTADVPPPCPVCGDALSVASMGGGNATVWTCSELMDDPDEEGHLIAKPGRGVNAPSMADETAHWVRSRWTQGRSGDSSVLELLTRFERATAIAEQARDFLAEWQAGNGQDIATCDAALILADTLGVTQ